MLLEFQKKLSIQSILLGRSIETIDKYSECREHTHDSNSFIVASFTPNILRRTARRTLVEF